MDFNLAKKLKDAGFPQNYPEGVVYAGDPPPIFPNLSELVEACGAAFSELEKFTHTKEPQKWSAVSYSCIECNLKIMKQGYGSTPEEAVANLYLELKKL